MVPERGALVGSYIVNNCRMFTLGGSTHRPSRMLEMASGLSAGPARVRSRSWKFVWSLRGFSERIRDMNSAVHNLQMAIVEGKQSLMQLSLAATGGKS